MLDRGPAMTPKVLHLISSLRVGGAERLLVSSMQSAAASGMTGFAVAIMNDEIDENLFAELAGSDFPVYRLGRRQGHMHPRYLAAVLKICRDHAIQIIHAHNEGSRFWAMLAKAVRPSLRVVYTVHSQGDAGSIRGLKRLAYQRLVDATVSISSCISAEASDLAGAGLTQIENGIDFARFAAGAAARPESDILRLVNVGRFAPVKGQDILLDALRICLDAGLDVKCTLAGTIADTDFYSRLLTKISELALTDHVTIVLDRLDIENVLAGADVFVLPSREEGFGLAVVEAMAASLPVIASRVGGPAELVSDGQNGLHFQPSDPADLARAITRLATDSGLRDSLRQKGKVTAARYDISETLRSHGRLYRSLIQS